MCVCPSSRDTSVLYSNGWRYHHFSVMHPHYSSFWTQTPLHKSKGTLQRGALNELDVRKKSQFSDNISLYVNNCTGQAHTCYETLIGSHSYLIHPCQFRWPWVTFKHGTRGPTFSGECSYRRRGNPPAYPDKVIAIIGYPRCRSASSAPIIIIIITATIIEFLQRHKWS